MASSAKLFSTLREIGDHETQGMIIFNVVEKSILYLNEEAQVIIGVAANQSINLIDHFIKMVVPEDKAYLKTKFIQLWNNSFLSETEFRLRGPRGTLLVVCCNAHVVMKNTTVVLFIKDISKLKQHEDYLVDFGAQKNTLLDTLVHNVSGALQLMKHLSSEAERSIETLDVENLRIYVNLLKENNQHCLDIISDLLKEEHTETLRISIKTSRIDIVGKIHIVYQNLKKTYKDRNFTFNASSPTIYIKTDEFKLLQIVNNLLSNAIKFTEHKNEISITISESDEEVICSIGDRGIGIPEELKPFLFDRKSISGRAGLNDEKSTGIGLFVSRKLVELMHGRIWFDSIENQGSTFYFALPKHLQ
jgi:two-component system sensor histidine kinase VicK